MTLIEPARSGLPDPEMESEFYEGVPLKRFIAWMLDVVFISLLTMLALPLTAFLGLLFLPFLFALVGFLYRWVGLARLSATPGMWLAAVEIRTAAGERLDAVTAMLHVGGYYLSVLLFPLQLVSAALIMVTPRVQGLTDLALGTAAMRRAARSW